MSAFKCFFKKPNILSGKSENTLICHNLITPIIIETLGWGWLRIKAKDEPSWPGIKKYQSLNDSQLMCSAPFDKELQISMVNFFGKSNLIMAPIKANSALHEIVAPQYPIYNKNLLNVINPPKYSSFKKVTFNSYDLPKNKVTKALQLSKQSIHLPNNKIQLGKLNLLNTPVHLFKSPFNYLNLINKLRLNRIRISNKIDTTFIQND